MGCCSHQHKHTGRGPRSEFLFHILSAGCVMMPFIKVGNYLTEVLCYWIWGQICRHNWRRVDVKSLSGHSEEGISIKGGGWMATHPPVTVSSPGTLADSTPAPPRNRPSVLSQQLLKPRSSTDPFFTEERKQRLLLSIIKTQNLHRS